MPLNKHLFLSQHSNVCTANMGGEIGLSSKFPLFLLKVKRRLKEKDCVLFSNLSRTSSRRVFSKLYGCNLTKGSV